MLLFLLVPALITTDQLIEPIRLILEEVHFRLLLFQGLVLACLRFAPRVEVKHVSHFNVFDQDITWLIIFLFIALIRHCVIGKIAAFEISMDAIIWISQAIWLKDIIVIPL